jgi:hypothetical protein
MWANFSVGSAPENQRIRFEEEVSLFRMASHFASLGEQG